MSSKEDHPSSKEDPSAAFPKAIKTHSTAVKDFWNACDEGDPWKHVLDPSAAFPKAIKTRSTVVKDFWRETMAGIGSMFSKIEKGPKKFEFERGPKKCSSSKDESSISFFYRAVSVRCRAATCEMDVRTRSLDCGLVEFFI